MKRATLMYSILVAAVGCGGTHDTTGDDTATDSAPDAAPALRHARVVNTLGQGLSLRDGPGKDHAVLLVMPEGAIVDVLAGPVDGWYQVTYEGTTGWAFGDYLAIFGLDDRRPPRRASTSCCRGKRASRSPARRGTTAAATPTTTPTRGTSGCPSARRSSRRTAAWCGQRRVNSTGGGCDPAFVNEANYVVVTRSDGFESLYVHLSAVTVPVGAVVHRGDLVGFSGQTGYSCGPHLHYQVQPGPDAGGTTFYANRSVPSAFYDSGTAYDPVAGDVLTSHNSATSGRALSP